VPRYFNIPPFHNSMALSRSFWTERHAQRRARVDSRKPVSQTNYPPTLLDFILPPNFSIHVQHPTALSNQRYRDVGNSSSMYLINIRIGLGLTCRQLDPDTVTNAIMADDDPEIQGSTAMSPEPMESMPQAFSNPLASSTPFPNQPTTLSPEPMESMPQPFPDPLASSTPIPSQPTTMSPEPMESMPQTTPNPLASPTPLPNPITSQTSLSPYTLHQTAPPFTPTTEGPALTSPPSGIATRPSLVSEIHDALAIV
jgi:hypothetical protein